MDRAVSDTEDFDSEDYMPIPHAGTGPSTGKASAQAAVLLSSDDDEDDCCVLEPLDIMPLEFTFPMSPTSATTGEETGGDAGAGTRKRSTSVPKKREAPAVPKKKRKISGVKRMPATAA